MFIFFFLYTHVPNYKKGVTVKVPALSDALMILKHNFHKCPEVGTHDRGVEVHWLATLGFVRDASNTEDALDFEIVGQLKGCIRWSKGDTINTISLLPINYSR